MIPNRLLKQVGEAAARFNQRTTEHAPGCCVVCRRALVDLVVALTDPSNWMPDSPDHQIQRLREQVESLQEALSVSGAFAATPAAPIAPVGGAEEGGAGSFFPPSGRGSEDD